MEETRGFQIIKPDELKAWLERDGAPRIIDTLPEAIYEQRRLPGALNACVYEVTFPEQVEAIARDRDHDLVVYGSSDASWDALVAAEKLVRRGYSKVFALRGGVAAWVEAGYPVEGGEDVEPERVEPRLLPESRLYVVDADQSVIEWTGRKPNGQHHGTVKLSKGQITVQQGAIGGTFEIDMGSIKNIDLEGDPLQPVLLQHLASDDFFFVKVFPKATFTIASAGLVDHPTMSSPNFEVRGELKMRGVGAEIAFPATANRLDDGGVAIEAHFDIDRTRWNVIYGSSRFFEHLGMHLVYDLISMEVRIVAR
jgi:polyisoprenoid-binding protein YceI/rhodanese-related sulfurtransferase